MENDLPLGAFFGCKVLSVTRCGQMPLLTTLHTVGIRGGRGGLGVVGWSASGMFTLRKHLPRENSACNRPGK